MWSYNEIVKNWVGGVFNWMGDFIGFECELKNEEEMGRKYGVENC